MSVTPQALQRAKADHRTIERLQSRVERLEQQVATLATKLAAVNDKQQRAGTTVALAAGANDITLTWPTPWPDTAYGVYIELVSGSGALGSLHHTLKVGSKTTIDCIVTISASAPFASVGVDILGVRTF